MESEEKKDNCGIEKISLPSKICQTSCRICQSNYLKEIHLLRDNGSEYPKIISVMKEKYNQEYSTSSLSRHFQNYNKIKTYVASQIMKSDIVDDATKRAVHCSAITELLDEYLELLKARLNNGLIANVADLEKLMNIRYKLLSGDDDGEKDLTVIFNNAMNRCPTLFDGSPDEPPVVEVSPERKEEDLVEAT